MYMYTVRSLSQGKKIALQVHASFLNIQFHSLESLDVVMDPINNSWLQPPGIFRDSFPVLLVKLSKLSIWPSRGTDQRHDVMSVLS